MRIGKETYKDSLLLNRDVLEEFGRFINLRRERGTSDDKYLMECFSRWCLYKFQKEQFPDVVNVTQESFFNHWDVTLGKGPMELALEGKVRAFTSDEYNGEYKISYKKTTWEEIRGKRMVVVMTFTDGKQYVFKVEDGHLEDGDWSHTQTTGTENGNESKWISEPAVVYDRDRALFSVDIALPPIDGNTKWTKEQFNW